jgi:hypothetical protein
MHIIQIGQKGYLKAGRGAPTCTTTESEARPFATRKQGQRAATRLVMNHPEFAGSGATVITASKG